MSFQLPDVQASSPSVTMALDKVGVTDVQKLLKIKRDEQRPIVLMADFEVYVDLPSWRKGADMSRNVEVIHETLEAAVDSEVTRVEDVCGETAERLLEKHEYTSRAEVKLEAEYVTRERTPESDAATQSTVDLIASATATEDGFREEVGATVTGMTVCPCSQGMSETRARSTLSDLGVDDDTINEFLDKVPQPGHSQRGHATLTVESDVDTDVDLEKIIDIAREAMSARIYNLAKRHDEDHMTYQSHADAKFVEDCVRAMAEGVVDRLDHLPEDAVVTMRQSNDESIHQHNAHAERVVKVGTLRREVNSGTSADDD